MHNHARRFVHDDHITIAMHHIQIQILGKELNLFGRLCQYQGHHIARFHPVVALHRLRIDPNGSRVRRLLDAVARGVRHEIEQKLIYPQQLLSGFRYKSEMLIELFFVPFPGFGYISSH